MCLKRQKIRLGNNHFGLTDQIKRAGSRPTVEHAVGDGSARRNGLVVMVGVRLALFAGCLGTTMVTDEEGRRNDKNFRGLQSEFSHTVRDAMAPFSWLSSRDLT